MTKPNAGDKMTKPNALTMHQIRNEIADVLARHGFDVTDALTAGDGTECHLGGTIAGESFLLSLEIGDPE